MNVKLLYLTSGLGIAGFASLALALFVFQPVQPVSAPTTPIQPGMAKTGEVAIRNRRPQVMQQHPQIRSVAEVEARLKQLRELPKQHAGRERVRLIRALPGVPGGKHALLRLARDGSDTEKLVAVNVLWARGERQEVRALAKGNRLLAAKVDALERAKLR